jgi:hypothetical protein
MCGDSFLRRSYAFPLFPRAKWPVLEMIACRQLMPKCPQCVELHLHATYTTSALIQR